MKTAIQTAIDMFTKNRNYCKLHHAENPQMGIMAEQYTAVIQDLATLLPTEQQQIEDAYTDGSYNGFIMAGTGRIDGCTRKTDVTKTSSEYFTDTFTPPC